MYTSIYMHHIATLKKTYKLMQQSFKLLSFLHEKEQGTESLQGKKK
jgi:hypothetical protein